MAEKFIWHCWEDSATTPNLCCGLGGRAYALAYYSHISNTAIWHTRAQYLADKAIEVHQTVSIEEMPSHSLYKGQLGIALMASEIDTLAHWSMPFFGSEY